MPVNARQYRDTVYRLRSHPGGNEVRDFSDQRDSLIAVYASFVPFLVFEYLSEASAGMLPSGLIFPLGFLLFWAFYYTYYKPGFLEERLNASKKGDLSGLPTLLIGVLIWFVKVTFVELTHFMVTRWLVEKPKAKPQSASGRPHQKPHGYSHANRSYSSESQRTREQERRTHSEREESAQKNKANPSSNPRARSASKLSPDLQQALLTLGIPNCRDWKEIHARYRTLAKQFHPDLNPDITSLGRRFIMYDVAYKKLQAAKNLFGQ